MPLKVWLSALLLSFGVFILLLLLPIATIFLVLLILILALGSAVLTKLFISGSDADHTMLERWLFVFVSSQFIYLVALLVEGDLVIIAPLVLIYGLGLFIFHSIRSFALYFILTVTGLGFQFFWMGNELINFSYASLTGYLAIFFSILLFSFLYNHDLKVKNKAFSLMNEELGRYQTNSFAHNEFVIRTNKDLEIISLSQNTQRTLFSYQTTVLGKKLFTVLYIKDEQGVLIGNNNKLMSEIVTKQEKLTLDKLVLLLPNTAKQYACVLSVHPIITINGVVDQIEFGLTIPALLADEHTKSNAFESQRMAFSSMLMTLQRQLVSGGKEESLFTVELLKKAYQHLNLIQELDTAKPEKKGLVDSAQIIRSLVAREYAFITFFKTEFSLEIAHQHDKKEDKLFPKTIQPEVRELTGPYYTIQTDSQLFDQLISTVLYCLLAVTAFDNDKNIKLFVHSDLKKVMVNFDLMMSIEAQKSFNRLFKEESILNAGDVPYTLGIEPSLISVLLKLTGGKMEYEIGAQAKITLTFERYISKNTTLVSGLS